MKIDLYNLYNFSDLTRLAYPIVLDVLKVWAEERGWEARVATRPESRVDLDTDAAVVGFTVYTQTAPATYRVAAKLRQRGKVVLFGGPHFRGPSTFEEAVPYCDMIARSICREQMHQILTKVERSGSLPNGDTPLRIADTRRAFRYPNNFYQALRSRKWYQVPTIPTSLGCPYDCNFCSPYRQGEYLLREIETIHNEMAFAPGRLVLICDATFGLNRKHTRELMHAIAPLHKKIAVETTLARLRNPEFLVALAHGGVKWIAVGVETLNSKLRKHGSADPSSTLGEIVDRAHDLGIAIQGNFICGLDSDEPDFFEHVYECYDRTKLDVILMGILTPYPDTNIYRQLKSERRLLDSNWEHFDYHHVVYQPRQMSVDQLIDGYIELYRRVRDRRNIFREVFEQLSTHGVRAESLLLIANNTYQKFDSIRKRHLLRQSQKEIKALQFPRRPPTGRPSARSAVP